MSHAAGQVRSSETTSDDGWPTRTRDVSYVGDACTAHGNGDFDPADLSTVRGRFPGRHVTLDDDAITRVAAGPAEVRHLAFPPVRDAGRSPGDAMPVSRPLSERKHSYAQ